MAYLQEYFDFVTDAIRLEFFEPAGLSMFELGNQRIITGSTFETGKEHFTNLGISHTSVDLNGLDLALPLDLRKPELFNEFSNKFDILTNLGTTEHVEPISKQYECFSIIHSVVREGGIMVHMVPDVKELDVSGAWHRHCSLYYSEEFFLNLAAMCNYTVLENKVIFGLRSVCMRKETSPFNASRELFNLIQHRENV